MSAFWHARRRRARSPTPARTGSIPSARLPKSLPLAAQSLLLDVATSGEHYVAVGARGRFLLSDDGADWKQSPVPTRTTFTAVAAVDAHVWAVGHDGVIAHSADGGKHWEMQRQDPWKPDAERATPRAIRTRARRCWACCSPTSTTVSPSAPTASR